MSCFFPLLRPGNCTFTCVLPQNRETMMDENGIVLRLPDEREVVLRSEGGALTLKESTWHPTFGCSEPTVCLVARLLNSSEKTVFDWSNSD